MLTEQFVASIGTATKAPSNNATKDGSIFLHELQPLAAQRSIFKKSVTSPNCLAVSSSHIFAAQDKAVVHVYNRAKGNQEATVPFNERITSLALACDDTVLVLGTAEGRIFFWELASGRHITTSQAQLREIDCLAVDPTSNFLLSGSKDSTVLVWSISSALSFTNTQPPTSLSTFSQHRSEVTAIVVGHSASFCNIAVSASTDKTCLLWDYHTNSVLRTFLLLTIPLCLALDPADRALYVGYEDGSLQQLDLYALPNSSKFVAPQSGGESAAAPIQPTAKSRWLLPESKDGAALSISVSYDGYTILSGHESGVVIAWDAAARRYQSNAVQPALPGPVTNLQFLPVEGFSNKGEQRTIKIPTVVKPRFGAFDTSSDGTVPANYSLNIEFAADLTQPSDFERALTAPTFPQVLLDQGLAELSTFHTRPSQPTASTAAHADGDDFMAFEDSSTAKQPSLQEQNTSLKAQLAALKRVQAASFERMEKLELERKALVHRQSRRARGNGANGINEADESESDEDSDG